MSDWSQNPVPRPGPPASGPRPGPPVPLPGATPPVPGPFPVPSTPAQSDPARVPGTAEPAAPAAETTPAPAAVPEDAENNDSVSGVAGSEGPESSDLQSSDLESGEPAGSERTEPVAGAAVLVESEAAAAADSAEDTVIDRLSERLQELDEIPISEHPARYEALHTELSQALTVLDRAARTDAPQAPRR